MFFSAPRQAKTSLHCPDCKEFLDIRRSCHEAYMHCPVCRKDFALNDFVKDMDEAMELFLEQIYSDRV